MRIKNKHAQALGKLGGKANAGGTKKISNEEKDRRRVRLAFARTFRWATA